MTGNKPTTLSLPHLARRRPVAGAPGVYYRPRADATIGPPYEFSYLDLSGHRRWRVVHGTIQQALAEQAQHRQRVRRHVADRDPTLTFERYARDWQSTRAVRPRTAERYRWAIEQHLLPRLGRHPLSAIDPEMIGRLLDELRRQDLKGWSISTVLQPLAMILNHAVRNGHIQHNPIKGLGRQELPTHADRRTHRILNLDEMQALIAASHNPRDRGLIELLLTSGLRIGEALGLTASNLDPHKNLIHVDRQLNRQKTRDELKTTSSNRVIDLPPSLIEPLNLLAERDATDDPNAQSRRVTTAYQVSGTLRRPCERLRRGEGDRLHLA
jgi:integrase